MNNSTPDVWPCVEWEDGYPTAEDDDFIAFIESRPDTSYFMLSWRRGGHYLFEIPVSFLLPPEEAQP